MNCRETTLTVEPGEGILARREMHVLFVPVADGSTAELLDAFTGASDDAVWADVSGVVMERSFSSPPFVCIDFSQQITLRVFGDVSATTDLPSVPMLSGVGSSTWVEHAAPGSDSLSTAASIACHPMGVDDARAADEVVPTDLQAGVVPAGGFTLTLRPQSPQQTSPQSPALGADRAPQSDRIARALDALGETEPDDAESPDTVIPEAVAPETVIPEMVAPETITPGTVIPETMDHDIAPPAVDEPDVEDDRTLMPAEVASAPSIPSVIARLCGDGHPNRPSRLTCSSCDSFLTPGEGGLELVARPTVGTLVFDDGIKVDLDKPVLIGRAPDPGERADAEPVETLVFDSDRVSRTHLEVRLSEWDVAVVDHSSRNGTVVVPADGAQPVKVDPSAPQLIEPGAVVYFGTRSFTLR